MRINCDEIRRRIKEEKLIENYLDLETQLQPAGFDLTVSSVYRFYGTPRIGFYNKDRVLPEYQKIDPISRSRWWTLSEGSYHVRFHEIVNIPLDLFAESIHRSTMMRGDCETASGYWDPGYSGAGATRLTVGKNGVHLKEGARICQMIFTLVDPPKTGYDGKYQNENVEKK